ncbi:MAG: NAD(P)-binding domain-containing protein [Prolixibacteraceae bacterium]|nr:NAD(P)-binding domain-containing protein [Prolixibacteraceae bacterium]
MKTTIGFIGGGRITKIFLHGFSDKNALPQKVKVYEPNAETLKALKADFPEVELATSPAEAATQKIVFLAVHPPVMIETLQAIKNAVSENTTVISLAPKITLEKMASILPTKKLVRMIPNATSFINEGFNPVTFAADFDEKDKKQLLKLLKKLGKTIEGEEPKLEGYAIVSAMLPTYFWFQWQEIENIAIETGLTEKEAKKAVYSTLDKALKIYYKSGLTPAEVMDLIPVKPIGENEAEIRNILNTKLMGLFGKIKP